MTVHCTEGKHHFRSPNLILVILVLNFAYIHSKRRKIDMFTLGHLRESKTACSGLYSGLHAADSIPGTGFRTTYRGTWIPDSKRQREPDFMS